MKLKTTDKIVVEITHQQEKALEDVFAYSDSCVENLRACPGG